MLTAAFLFVAQRRIFEAVKVVSRFYPRARPCLVLLSGWLTVRPSQLVNKENSLDLFGYFDTVIHAFEGRVVCMIGSQEGRKSRNGYVKELKWETGRVEEED